MNYRPSDWSAVDRSSDPTPGDPDVVRTGGQKYQEIAGALSRAASTLRRLNGGASSGADSVKALLENCDDVEKAVSAAQGRYQAAGDALVTYSYALDSAQIATSQALSAAQTPSGEAKENTRLANSYAREASRTTDPDEKARLLGKETTYRNKATTNRTSVSTQKGIITQAVIDLDTAARTAITKIEDVTSNDGLNDSWWDNWGSKVVTWITDIAQMVAEIASILALVVGWIPVIGQALAGILLTIAAVAAIIAIIGNLVLAATGERSWGEALVNIASAALCCVGCGWLSGAAKGLKVGGIALKAAGRAGKAVGSAGKAIGRAIRAGGDEGATSLKIFGAVGRGAKGATSVADDAGEVLARGVTRRSDGVVEISLKKKPGWTPSQVRQATQKVADGNARNPVVTQVRTRPNNQRALWEKAHGKITQPFTDVDHILDLQLGGQHVLGNFQLLDRSVNRSLGSQISNAIKRAGLQPGTPVRLNI